MKKDEVKIIDDDDHDDDAHDDDDNVHDDHDDHSHDDDGNMDSYRWFYFPNMNKDELIILCVVHLF